MTEMFSTVQSLHGALNYHMDRHNLLASNVAHVDTPGYKPVDLRRTHAGFETTLRVHLNQTNTMHQAGAAVVSARGEVFEDLSAGGGRDGNFVSLDREAAKVAANQLRYDTITALASAHLRQLSYAANDGKG